MTCITSARMTMIATVLRGRYVQTQSDNPQPTNGHFEPQEDLVTGEIISVWVPDTEETEITDGEGHIIQFDVPCKATAFTDTGYRSASNTESFDEGIYRRYEYVEMRFPPSYVITSRDTVTAIRDARSGKALWVEEEALLTEEDVYPATDFDVIGVNPVFDPFGTHIENLTVLKRAEVQSGRD